MTGALSPTLEGLTSDIHDVAASLRRKQAALIAVTGIDAGGKGYLAGRLGESLRQQGLRTAIINIDGWLNLRHIRFGKHDPGAHFYENAIRFEEMFEQLVLPLKERRAVSVEANFTAETAKAYTKHHYHFKDVDVILLEGIYLLKWRFQTLYDLAVWIDCTFETALERAIVRNQRGCPVRTRSMLTNRSTFLRRSCISSATLRVRQLR